MRIRSSLARTGALRSLVEHLFDEAEGVDVGAVVSPAVEDLADNGNQGLQRADVCEIGGQVEQRSGKVPENSRNLIGPKASAVGGNYLSQKFDVARPGGDCRQMPQSGNNLWAWAKVDLPGQLELRLEEALGYGHLFPNAGQISDGFVAVDSSQVEIRRVEGEHLLGRCHHPTGLVQEVAQADMLANRVGQAAT